MEQILRAELAQQAATAAAAVAAPLLQANPPVAANWGRSTASTAAAAAVTAMTNIQSQSVLEER